MKKIGQLIISFFIVITFLNSSQDLAYGKNKQEKHNKSKKKKSVGFPGKVKVFVVKNKKAIGGAGIGVVAGSVAGPLGSLVGAAAGAKIGSMVGGEKEKDQNKKKKDKKKDKK